MFIDADKDADGVLRAIHHRRDLPPPSYVLRSSPNRAHIFWRVTAFTSEVVEGVQKALARQLGTDLAATACTQMTRAPGFYNRKYTMPHLVAIAYHDTERRRTPADFPAPVAFTKFPFRTAEVVMPDVVERARRYAAAVPSAITGAHGDQHPFRLCCRLARGFALSDGQALDLLQEWNAQCQPPWSERELMDKLNRARRYGRELIGGLLETQP